MIVSTLGSSSSFPAGRRPFAPPSLVFVDITTISHFNDALVRFVSSIHACCFVSVVLSPVVSSLFPVSHVIRVIERYR